jgi:PEP-CTERM motif
LVTDEYAAIRPFTGALAAGQAFSFVEQLNNGSNPGNGGPSNLGFSLDDSSGNVLFDFAAQGGGPGYLLTDATQTAVPETTVPYNYHSIDTFSFALNSVGPTSAAYTFTASGGNVSGGTQSFTGTISMLTGGITQADIYNNNGGEGSDVQFDDLAITNVPEPVSFGLAGLGAASLLARRRSRSR